jgi:aryl-alcohol dehydrogenase-like predicted oxidoreductase
MINSYPPVIPLVAGSTTEQMEENYGALEIKLTPEDMTRLNQASA